MRNSNTSAMPRFALVAAMLLSAGACAGQPVEDEASDGQSTDAFGAFSDVAFTPDKDAQAADSGAESGDVSLGSETTGTTADAGPADTGTTCPGGPECACQSNDDCDNALCIDVEGGKHCALPCVDACPAGFSCAPVDSGGGDLVNVCVPRLLRLCDPCKASDDCKVLGVSDTACLDLGSAGAFCSVGCDDDADCEADYLCTAATSVEGGAVKMCTRKPDKEGGAPGDCPCSEAAVDAQLSTVCYVEHYTGANELVGKCAGARTCGKSGLSECAAAALDVETCDGKDNDCDGQTDEDACTDTNGCTQSVCDPSVGCKITKLDGSQCDADGTVCTENDTCSNGICVPGKPKQCDDNNACTIAACDMAKGCTQTLDNGKPCDADGTDCTLGDTCVDGACKSGQQVPCDDQNACTTDACEPNSGKCSYKPLPGGVACDDNSACTVADVCFAGQCAGSSLTCDDKNPCTANTCDPTTGCKVTPLEGAGCDDDNPCTIGDVCKAKACVAGTPKTCASGDSCVLAKCKITTGKCDYTERPDGEACNDGSACSTSDACKSGSCLGKVLACDDSNPCTSDTCDKASGCKHGPLDQACDDGNQCTKGDFCSKGACAGKAIDPKVDCDDGKACTDEGCAAKSGCTHTNNQGVCDDGDPCTKGDSCLAGQCSAGTSTCECKVDSDCKLKEDGDFCNGTLYCDKSNANYACKVNPKTIVTCSVANDGQCEKSTCVAKTGACQKKPANQGQTCDADGSLCTKGDVCESGVCKAGAPLDCTDTNVCTDDSCDPKKGCVKKLNTKNCSDGNACTVTDTCSLGACAGATKKCDDGEVCTDDDCDKKTGCTTAANAKSCNDGDACTTGDGCANSKCGGTQKPCNDNNLCTNDSCDKIKGCVFTNNSVKCPDGDACTESEICQGGACNKTKKVCDDGNVCTADSCDKTKGCQTKASNEGGVCGSGKTCKAGVCATACQSGTKLMGATGGGQSFTVPSCAKVVVLEAWGAEGGKKGNGAGGRGAYMKGSFANLAGKSLTIMVGRQGTNVTCNLCGGGGGGGSFISVSGTNTPLLIAGGGGGASYQQNSGTGGVTSQAGGPGGYSSVSGGQGGNTDNGGGGGTGAGGGGWNGAGKSNNWSGGGAARGGTGGTSKYTGVGGFGGGGGAFHGGGGGGGYSGGGGGTYSKGGGGGGSICAGTLNASQSGAKTGHGSVRISW